MKKRLIVIFSIFIVVVLLILLSSTVFSVSEVEVNFYNQEGSPIASPQNFDATSLLGDYKGKSIFFINEENFIKSIYDSGKYSDWYVVEVERSFPNKIIMHITQRLPVFYIECLGENYLLDVFGYPVDTIADYDGQYIDISYMSFYVESISIGKEVVLRDSAPSQFTAMSRIVQTAWRLNFNYENINLLLSSFAFNDDIVSISLSSGVKINIENYIDDIESKFIRAMGVYYNGKIDVTAYDTVISVDKNGRVTSTNDNK